MAAVVVARDTSHIGYFDLNQKELRNPRLHQLGADPGSPVDGQILYRTDTNKVRVRINGAWQDLATTADVVAGGISSSIVDAKGDLIAGTADNTVSRFAVGTDGQALRANSAQATGLQWRDDAVTDIKGVTTARIIGRTTAGTGAAEELTAAQAKTLLAIVPGDITGFDTQVRTNRLDQMSAPTAAVSLNSQKITNLADGTNATDAVNLQQLTSAIEGRQLKDPVDAATTGALPNTPTYNNAAGTLTAGSNTTLAAQDGVTLAVGDSLLVKNQASAFQNGIYTLTAAGSGAAPWVLTRRADASTASELTDATTLIDSGTTLKGKIYTGSAVTTLGTDASTWTVTGDITVYTASGGVTLTGTNFDTTVSGLSGGMAVGDLLYASGAAALAKLADVATGNALLSGGVTTAPAWGKVGLTTHVNGTLPIANGGTNATDAATARANLGAVGKASGTLTGGANTEVITHNLNTRDCVIRVYLTATPWSEVEVDIAHTSVNTATIGYPSGVNIPASTYSWVAIG